MERKTHIIDAKDRTLGRLGSEISKLLRGKYKVNFEPNKDLGDFVIIKNVDKIKFTGKKFEKKIYYRHTGYLGHFKKIPLKELFWKDKKKLLRKVVWGMMPKNKLSNIQIKRLNIK